MDTIKYPYYSFMRPFRDRLDILVAGRWRISPPGAKRLPFPHAFHSRHNDADNEGRPDDAIGEVPGGFAFASPVVDTRLSGQTYCGSIEVWQFGALYAQRGTPAHDVEGIPLCCHARPLRPGGLNAQGNSRTVGPEANAQAVGGLGAVDVLDVTAGFAGTGGLGDPVVYVMEDFNLAPGGLGNADVLLPEVVAGPVGGLGDPESFDVSEGLAGAGGLGNAEVFVLGEADLTAGGLGNAGVLLPEDIAGPVGGLSNADLFVPPGNIVVEGMGAAGVAETITFFAGFIDLYNTGVIVEGETQYRHCVIDQHWQLDGGAAMVVIPGAGAWVQPADYQASRYLSVECEDAHPKGPTDPYTYSLTFTIEAGTTLAGMTLTGREASDDAVIDLRVNGVSTGYNSSSSWVSWSTFTIDGSFLQEGTNTIEFDVLDTVGINWTGFRCEFQGWA